MIIIDALYIIFTPIIFLPFMSYLVKKKRNLFYYVLYGILLDLLFINKFFLNTLTFLIFYFKYPKKIRLRYYYFIILILLILVINSLINNNLHYIFDYSFYLSLFVNIFYYKYCNKNKKF